MSAIEFGLPSESPVLSPLSPMPFDRCSSKSGWSPVLFERLFQLSRSIASMTPEVLSGSLVALLRPLFPCELASIVVFDARNLDCPWRSLGSEKLAQSDIPIEETTIWSVYEERKPLWVLDWQTDERTAVREEAQRMLGIDHRSLCRLPLCTSEGCLGVLSVASSHPHSFSEEEILLMSLAADQVALGLENWLLHAEVKKLRSTSEPSCDGDECMDECSSTDLYFEEIVGRSPALKRLLREVEVVAPTDSGVLIQGETGTGKELIAQAIHNRSGRKARPFVKVNCAAIPSGLLESELFGHEKGAFTGAIMRKPGRFEVADKGTLFLDEVGDIPLDLQSKLLRVLQEREFERLGSTHTQQVDVRVIAATHRDLKQMVEEGTFRRDLYYRLHVFPVTVPALRDRREDIPLLARHFVETYAARMNRRIETIPPATMDAMLDYSWPGNVRELQHFIERAVILSAGTSLSAPVEELKQESTIQLQASEQSQPSGSVDNTLLELEREHVLRALKESNWITGGPRGAAARLGVKRTTLAYRIRKLGIPRPQ